MKKKQQKKQMHGGTRGQLQGAGTVQLHVREQHVKSKRELCRWGLDSVY